MPTLADIYSAINTAKRKGVDFVQNPGTSLQQMLGNANDRARALNEQDRAATDEFLATGKLNGPLQMQSAMDLAGAYNPAGMISNSLTAKYPNVALDVFESPKAIDLSRIVVPPEMRNKGIGSQVMEDLIQYADETGKQVRLSPSSDFGGSPTRLKKFYKEFGFVENKGRNKDFSTRETMIRNPEEIKIHESTGLPMNFDKTVTLYHHTSPANAELIKKTKTLKSAGEPDVYLTTHPTPDIGYGDVAVPIKVNPDYLRLDDEFPNGRMDFALPVGKPGGSIKVIPK